jgi:hypothetical protein
MLQKPAAATRLGRQAAKLALVQARACPRQPAAPRSNMPKPFLRQCAFLLLAHGETGRAILVEVSASKPGRRTCFRRCPAIGPPKPAQSARRCPAAGAMRVPGQGQGRHGCVARRSEALGKLRAFSYFAALYLPGQRGHSQGKGRAGGKIGSRQAQSRMNRPLADCALGDCGSSTGALLTKASDDRP